MGWWCDKGFHKYYEVEECKRTTETQIIIKRYLLCTNCGHVKTPVRSSRVTLPPWKDPQKKVAKKLSEKEGPYTIEEIRQLRNLLTTRIDTDLKKFEKDTGAIVKEVKLFRDRNQNTGKSRLFTIDLDVEIGV